MSEREIITAASQVLILATGLAAIYLLLSRLSNLLGKIVIHGKAPIGLHDVARAIMTCPAGARPVPVNATPAIGQDPMRDGSIVIVLHDNGRAFELAPYSFALAPHVAANANPDAVTQGEYPQTIPVGPEQPARLVFHVRLPAGYALESPLDRDESERQEAAALADRMRGLKPLATTQAAVDLIEMAANEQAGTNPETLAIVATRAAHGLDPESPPEVFATDHELLTAAHRRLNSKPLPGTTPKDKAGAP